MNRPPTRRTLLASGAATLAGCVSVVGDSEPRYRLSARRVGRSLAPHFDWKAPDAFERVDRELATRVVDRGEVTTVGFHLGGVGTMEPRYLERGGTYYEISVERADPVTRERWLLWFDRVDGDPTADAEVYTSALGLGDPTRLDEAYGLSAADVRAVEHAEGRVPTEFEYRDLEREPPRGRGHLFVRRSADATALVPDPPFTHVAFESGDGTVYARAVVEEVSVELDRFVHRATPVADAAVYEQSSTTIRPHCLRRRGPPGRATLRPRRAIARSGLRGGGPALGWVHDRPRTTRVADAARPEPRMVEFSEDVFFSYDGASYEGRLEMFG